MATTDQKGISSPEYKALRDHYHTLSQLVGPFINELAAKLFAKNLISKTEWENVTVETQATTDRSASLLMSILTKIEHDLEVYETLVAIFKEFPVLDNAVKDLESTYQALKDDPTRDTVTERPRLFINSPSVTREFQPNVFSEGDASPLYTMPMQGDTFVPTTEQNATADRVQTHPLFGNFHSQSFPEEDINRNEKVELKKQLQKKEREIQDLTARADDLDTMNKGLQQKVDEVKKQAQQDVDEVKLRAEKDVAEVKLRAEKEVAEVELRAEKELKELQQRLAEEQKRAEDKEEELKKAKSDFKDLENELMKYKLEDLAAKLKEKEDAEQLHLQEKKAAEAKQKEAEAKQEETQAKLKEKEDAEAELKKKLEAMEKELEEYKKRS